MISSIFGKWMTGKRLIWTSAALMTAVAIPAVGATTHLIHKASLTHRTPSHAMVHHSATARSATHAKAKTASSGAHRPGYPLALSAVTSMHSGHASATHAASTTKHNTTKVATASHKSKPLSSTAKGAHVTPQPVSAWGSPTLH